MNNDIDVYEKTDINNEVDIDINIFFSKTDITIIKKIGEGEYGTVYETSNGNIIKCFKYPYDSSTIRELSVIKCLKSHPNIVTTVRNYVYGNVLILEMEKAKCDLQYCIQNINKEHRPYIMWQLLHAIKHMHSYNVAHRDIKPSNILLFDDITIKLCDFGLSKFGVSSGKTHTNEVVTIWYRAPEVILNPGKYTYSVDIWACGTTLLQMILGDKYPLKDENEMKLLIKIFNLIGTPTEKSWKGVSTTQRWKDIFPKFKGNLKRQLRDTNVSEDEYDLLQKLLSWEPSRITAQDALKHPYFKNVRNDDRFSVSVESKIDINLKEHTIKQDELRSFKSTLFSWMWDVKNELTLSKEALIGSYFLFNEYCKNNHIVKKNIQLIGTCCLIISSNLYDIYEFNENTGSVITGNAYSKRLIKNTIRDILEYFEYDLIYFIDMCDKNDNVFNIMCCIMSSERAFTMPFGQIQTIAREIVTKVDSDDTKYFVSYIKQMPEEYLKKEAILCL